MRETTVAATEFQNRAGHYMDLAARGPVFITRHRRRARVLIDADDYARLLSGDTRRAYLVEELPEEWIEALENVDLSHLSNEAVPFPSAD